jgi:hypothetical protein
VPIPPQPPAHWSQRCPCTSPPLLLLSVVQPDYIPSQLVPDRVAIAGQPGLVQNRRHWHSRRRTPCTNVLLTSHHNGAKTSRLLSSGAYVVSSPKARASLPISATFPPKCPSPAYWNCRPALRLAQGIHDSARPCVSLNTFSLFNLALFQSCFKWLVWYIV